MKAFMEIKNVGGPGKTRRDGSSPKPTFERLLANWKSKTEKSEIPGAAEGEKKGPKIGHLFNRATYKIYEEIWPDLKRYALFLKRFALNLKDSKKNWARCNDQTNAMILNQFYPDKSIRNRSKTKTFNILDDGKESLTLTFKESLTVTAGKAGETPNEVNQHPDDPDESH